MQAALQVEKFIQSLSLKYFPVKNRKNYKLELN